MKRPLPPGIEQRGDRFRWRIAVNGIRRTGTARTLAAAERARLEAKLDAGGDMIDDDHTVQAVIDMWLADVDHAESTAARRDIALAAIPDTFKARLAATVTPPVAAALWRQMAKAGTGAHTIVKASHALSQAFEIAVRYGITTSNPIRAAKPRRPPPSARVDPPSPVDVRRLLDHLADRPHLAAWARVMAVCGARPGEICGLQWDDVDVDRARITIRRGISRTGTVTPGKTGRAGHRDIVIDLPTIAALRRLDRHVGCPWVFSHDGQNPWRPDWVCRQIATTAAELGIAMRPYDLRHFAATQAIAAGRPIPEVAAMLGDNPATVMRTYAHANPDDSQAAATVAAILDR